MNKPNSIALFTGSSSWQAGVEYTRNLLYARQYLTEEERREIEIQLVCNEEDNFRNFSDLGEMFSGRYSWKKSTKKNNGPLRRFFQLSIAERAIEFYQGGKAVVPRGVFPILYTDYTGYSLPCSWAGWIPDLQHRFLPQFFSEEEIQKRDDDIKRLAARANKIVFSSHASLNDFMAFFQSGNNKSYVLPFCSFADSQPRVSNILEKYHLPENFFLVSNQFWVHKNHGIVFQTLGQLRRIGVCPTLVCTGSLFDGRNPGYVNQILKVLHQLGIYNQVYLLGNIPRAEQVQLMRQCLCVVQPSLFEGWSTVVEDARALKRPLILSDIAVHREQNPAGASFFNPSDPDQLSEILGAFWENSNSSEILSENLTPARRNFALGFHRLCLELSNEYSNH